MTRNLGIRDLNQILDYYHIKRPNTIHKLKKQANCMIVKHLCASNCDCQRIHKKLIYLLHQKRIMSNQKKIRNNKTKRQTVMIYKQTRAHSPIRYFDA